MVYKELYRESRETAFRLGQHDRWYRSFQENGHCARSIELSAKDAYASNRLSENTVFPLIGQYGYNRIAWVLANTIRQDENRYKRELRDWARTFPIPHEMYNLHKRYAVQAHPVLVGMFVDCFLKVRGVGQ